MHHPRAIQFALVAAGIIVVILLVAFLLGSKHVNKFFLVMQRCNNNGVCEANEAECSDCRNIAGSLSGIGASSQGDMRQKFPIALIAILGITLFEVTLISRRG